MFDHFLGRLKQGIVHIGKRGINTASRMLGQAHKAISTVRHSNPYQTLIGGLSRIGLDKPVNDFADRLQGRIMDYRHANEQYRGAINHFGKTGDWIPSRFVTKPARNAIERPPDPSAEDGLGYGF